MHPLSLNYAPPKTLVGASLKGYSLHCIIFRTATDPACGTAGFLVATGEFLRENRKDEIFYNKEKKDHYMNHMFYGFDMDRTMLRIGAMNMMTHGIDNPFIEYRDSLSDQNPDRNKYSLILANPPFKGSLDYEIVSTDILKTEYMFDRSENLRYDEYIRSATDRRLA